MTERKSVLKNIITGLSFLALILGLIVVYAVPFWYPYEYFFRHIGSN